MRGRSATAVLCVACYSSALLVQIISGQERIAPSTVHPAAVGVETKRKDTFPMPTTSTGRGSKRRRQPQRSALHVQHGYSRPMPACHDGYIAKREFSLLQKVSQKGARLFWACGRYTALLSNLKVRKDTTEPRTAQRLPFRLFAGPQDA